MSDIGSKAQAEWGSFRKFIAAHPLTGFWVGVALGIVGGGLLRGFLGGVI